MFGGSVWHTVGGARNAPKGQMIAQAIVRCKARAPILGGSFAIWGTFFSIFDCTLAHIRKKEDPYNAIASGALTGGEHFYWSPAVNQTWPIPFLLSKRLCYIKKTKVFWLFERGLKLQHQMHFLEVHCLLLTNQFIFIDWIDTFTQYQPI